MRERIEPLSALITLEIGKLPAENRGEFALSARQVDQTVNPGTRRHFVMIGALLYVAVPQLMR